MPYGAVKAAMQVREERATLEGYRHILYYNRAHYLASRVQPFFAGVFSFQGIRIFIIIECLLQNRIIGTAILLCIRLNHVFQESLHYKSAIIF